jgi:hypothetical protein
VLIRIQIWFEYATTARSPAKEKRYKSRDATNSRKSDVAGVVVGGDVNDSKGTNNSNERTSATTRTLATALPPTKTGKI